MAVDQKKAMRERETEVRNISKQVGKRVTVVLIESGDRDDEWRSGLTTIRTSTSVRATVSAVPLLHDVEHIIVMVTHEALKLADLSEFVGWHLVIDETPSVLDQQVLRTTLSRDFFERHYQLRRHGRRSQIVSASRATAADMRRDSLTASVSVMHSRVLSERTTVLTDLRNWSDLGEAGEWTWASIWSPEQLTVFETRLILANAFRRSLTYAVWSRMWPEIVWVDHRRLALRQYRRRKMTIRYFAALQPASRSLFSSDSGKERLTATARWIAAHTDPERHIWSCNEADIPVIGAGLKEPARLSPRQAGSNTFASATTVTILYTAKPSPAERGLFRDLDIDPMVATRTREYETIYQFVCRCAVRDPNSAEDLVVNVYDRQQAEYLHELFLDSGYVDATLELVDLGFGGTPPTPSKKRGPKAKAKTKSEIAADQQRFREQARARKQKQRARKRGVDLPPF
ncbi:hypothetical protein ACWGNZ_02825 [Sphingomonas zeae]